MTRILLGIGGALLSAGVTYLAKDYFDEQEHEAKDKELAKQNQVAQRAKEAFHHCVIITITFTRHTWRHLIINKSFAIFFGLILHTSIGVYNNPLNGFYLLKSLI